MNRKEQLLIWILGDHNLATEGFTADTIAKKFHLSRSVVSRYFNQLVDEGKLIKAEGRPVRFMPVSGLDLAGNPTGLATGNMPNNSTANALGNSVNGLVGSGVFALGDAEAFNLIGATGSLKKAVKQAKAAVMYPPSGLHTLIHGETGVGKSLFAKEMHRYALAIGRIEADAPFVVLNCADYADNPQLLMGELFGVKKGAYTGADKDREGLLQKADGGLLFLDEVHRLPPQGQEMLFTFMDYGHFRPLGGNKDVEGVEVQIIAATTENPASVLLDTFKRRIPILIELPALDQRNTYERKALIEMFLKLESIRIKKPIAISRNAFIALLLYECKSNIGQLRTDIQQACAKAFLHYVSNEALFLKVRSIDLSPEAKAGYNVYKTNRSIVDELLPPSVETLHTDREVAHVQMLGDRAEDFYTTIEEKIHALKDEGADDETIRQVVGADIDNRFASYIESMKNKVSEQMISKVVDPKVVQLSSKLMDHASEKLKREIQPSLRAAFTLHMASAIERILNRQPIYNPKLNQIRIMHPEAFVVAMDLARDMEMALGIVLPIDEIGYITMFLVGHETPPSKKDNVKVPIYVIMHGKSTASSMVEVVNELIGEPFAKAFDMPLSMPVEDMYQTVSAHFLEASITEAILMVDMGSLSNFGEMLYEDHGLNIRTLSQCSTPLVLEVARKVAAGLSMDEIYQSVAKGHVSTRSKVRAEQESNKLLILTACFTGEGTAERMKRIIEKRIGPNDRITVKSIDLADRGAYLATIDHYRNAYHLIAIASTLNIPVDQVPVFTALDLLQEAGLERLNRVIQNALLLSQISESIQETVEVPSYELVRVASVFIEAAEHALGRKMQKDARIGFMLHLVFYIDNRLKGKPLKPFESYKAFLLENGAACEALEGIYPIIESAFALAIPLEERALLCKVILSNLEA